MKRESAIITLRKPLTSGPRTYIVFGVMRGGTTMVAGIMRALNIFMGDNVNKDNQESGDFSGTSLQHMVETIERHNDQHEVWGWKFPNAASYLDRLLESVRNPHLICVFRDAVANGQGLQRWHPYGPLHGMQESLLQQQSNLNLITRRGAPAIMVSYEKAERNKELFLEEFSEILGTSPDRETFDFDGFMQGGSYKDLEDFYRK